MVVEVARQRPSRGVRVAGRRRKCRCTSLWAWWKCRVSVLGRIIGGIALLRPYAWARHLVIWISVLSILADGTRRLSFAMAMAGEGLSLNSLIMVLSLTETLIPNGLVLLVLNSQWVKAQILEQPESSS